MQTIFLLLTLLKIQQISSLNEDYYWRDYTGDIPADALVGGQDINNKNVYIGQAYVPNHGLIVSQIYPGVTHVIAPWTGVYNITSHIKILCGNPINFYWMRATAADLDVQLIGKRPIIGGFEDGGTLYIGRVQFEGGVKIGKITSFIPDNELLYFVNNQGRQTNSASYQILLYYNYAANVNTKTDS